MHSMIRQATLILITAFVAFNSAAATAAAPTAGDWPGWRGPNRDGKSPDTGLLKEWPAEGPKQLWKAEGIGAGYSTVAVVNGMIFTSGNANGRQWLFAFDLDGKPKWKVDYDAIWAGDHPGARSTPVVDNGLLYFISDNGLIGCLDAKTGNKVWNKKMSDFGGKAENWGYAESVLIDGKLAVVTPGGDKCIVALDKTTGQPVWTSTGYTSPPHYCSAITISINNVPMIVNGVKAGLVGVDARNGQKQWSSNFAANNVANCPTPAFSDGYLFWAVGYGRGGICFKMGADATGIKGEQAWVTKDLICHHGGYIIEQGYIYGNNDRESVCLDLKSGQKMWNNPGVGKGSVCWADGMLYLFSEKGGQAALATCSPKGMEIKGRVQVAGAGPSWAYPVVIGGRLYLRYDNTLYCFDVKAK